jgi:hypothetical protein
VYRKNGGMVEDVTSEALRENKFVEKIRQIHFHVKETLKKSQEKFKERHDQHLTKNSLKFGEIFFPQLNTERLHGPSMKIKDSQNGLFEVLEKVRDNAYKIFLPPHIHIYLVVNVDNLKLY